MTFYVRYQTYKYEGESHEELGTEEQVIALLNQHATNPDFWFEVIEGKRIEFEPAQVTTQYRVKRKG